MSVVVRIHSYIITVNTSLTLDEIIFRRVVLMTMQVQTPMPRAVPLCKWIMQWLL